MSGAIGLQCTFFLVSVLWGAILFVLYDILRIARRIKKHKWFTIAAEDVLYWILAALLIFRMMYEQNDGIIRGFSILGMGLGMIIYSQTISPYFVVGVSTFFLFIGRQIHRFLRMITKPFRKLCRFIKHKLKDANQKAAEQKAAKKQAAKQKVEKKKMEKADKTNANPLKKRKKRGTLDEQA